MSADPALCFRDSVGNTYVGVDVVDAEALEELLGAVLDLIDSPPVFEALTDYVPRTRLDHLVGDLANRLCYVRSLVRGKEVTPIS
jgi:hypothetical protein